jgi:hypothetical protein
LCSFSLAANCKRPQIASQALDDFTSLLRCPAAKIDKIIKHNLPKHVLLMSCCHEAPGCSPAVAFGDHLPLLVKGLFFNLLPFSAADCMQTSCVPGTS